MSLSTQGVLRISLLLMLATVPAMAGGPLYITGPSAGNAGQMITWPQGQPIRYRLDGGPLSSYKGTIVVSGAQASTRVQSLFQTWQSVPTANLNIQSAGSILSVPAQGTSPGFTDGDVSTVEEFEAVTRSCANGDQSPIIFDADGRILEDIGYPPEVIGFAGVCKIANGNIQSAAAVLDGRFIDGVNDPSGSPPNYELSPDGFDAVFIHEFGHFLGLDHSQINVQCISSCSADELVGLPTMFPVLMSVQQKSLAPDDMAWITTLYPNANAMSSYGKITGTIYFYDGISQAGGVNVVARVVDDPITAANESLQKAISVVSGYRFTGNPGQNVTGNNPGSSFGSRDPMLVGYFEILVPPGQYKVQVEPIPYEFTGGSSVGPWSPPIPMPGIAEFWHVGQTNNDDYAPGDIITVAAGQTVGNINFILNTRYTRSDALEDTSSLLIIPDLPGRKPEQTGGAA